MSRTAWLVCALAAARLADAAEDHSTHQHHDVPASSVPSQSEMEHVAPPPPTLTLEGMSDAQMDEMMQMNDNANIGTLRADRIEWMRTDHEAALGWDIAAQYGNDFNKLVLKSEGERSNSTTDSRNELLWDRIVSRWWSVQTGIRHDTHDGPSRTWAALGLHGLAAYWFDIDASLYIGDTGRTALRLTSEYELLLSQRWILEPRLELNAYGKQDVENGIGSGISDGELGIRLRYEIRREFAPYVGVNWTRRFGQTATLAEQTGLDRSEWGWVAGIKGWL